MMTLIKTLSWSYSSLRRENEMQIINRLLEFCYRHRLLNHDMIGMKVMEDSIVIISAKILFILQFYLAEDFAWVVHFFVQSSLEVMALMSISVKSMMLLDFLGGPHFKRLRSLCEYLHMNKPADSMDDDVRIGEHCLGLSFDSLLKQL